MRSRYKHFHDAAPYFVTCTTVNWVPIFTSRAMFDVIIGCLQFLLRRKIIMIRKISKTIISIGAVATLSLAISGGGKVFAQTEPYMGQLAYVAFNYAPQGWLQCDGTQLTLAQYNALYALLGVTYGGDGRTYFNLPDMRGRVPVHQGQGPGLPNYTMGQKGGMSVLSAANLPAHTHSATAVSTSTSSVGTATTATSTLRAFNGNGVAKTAGGNSLATFTGTPFIYGTATPNVDMIANSVVTTINNLSVNTNTTMSVTVAPAGTTASVSIMPPYLTVNCIIATEGIWPTRP